MSLSIRVLIGSIVALGIAWLAYRWRALSRSGGVSAWLMGTIIFGLGGWPWAMLLLAFFTTSSFLTRWFKKRKAVVEDKFAKGGQRDWGQVWANGGVAACFAALHALFPEASWTWAAFAASLAAVNADTWATELGVLNPSPPRLLINGKPVERGTSGGVSFYGLLAAWAGSTLIALLAVLLYPPSLVAPSNFTFYALWLSLAGFSGALFDSFLGATVQGIYHCPCCDKETEQHPRHRCGTVTFHLRGWKWINNDVVNLACALVGAAMMLVLWR